MNAPLSTIGVHVLKVSQCVQDFKTQYSILCTGEVQKYDLWCLFFISSPQNQMKTLCHGLVHNSGGGVVVPLLTRFCLLPPSNYCITCWRPQIITQNWLLLCTSVCLRLACIALSGTINRGLIGQFIMLFDNFYHPSFTWFGKISCMSFLSILFLLCRSWEFIESI